MAAALEDTTVTYEDLAEIEKDFDDVETEIIRQQVKLTAPIYARREKTVSQIPNFWPLVLEQAPPDIDQYLQPSDSAVLLSSLKALSVSHVALDESSAEAGDPRSFSIKLEFTENEYFEEPVLEKKFWHRRARDGWSGLVSEPVKINWKKGKDLTGGLLDQVCAAWEAEKPRATKDASNGQTKKEPVSEEGKALLKTMDQISMGGLSFFAWFGFIGRRISAEESAEATKVENERREKIRKGEKIEITDEEEDDDDEEELYLSMEIFPTGDELALAFKDDLWPDAIKYFTQAQEQDALSDLDFESGDEQELLDALSGEESDAGEEKPPAKKQRV